jgi:hypothetical protein
MKRMFWCAVFFLLVSAGARSQTKSKKIKSKQAVQSNSVQANKNTAASAASSGTVTLNNVGSYLAKANSLSVVSNNYLVTDPILTTLDARATGANIRLNKSGIVGMPKRAYGFANGHISLKNTGAVTTGTQTGSGAVATGTSLGTFGSNGPAMGVNGKSPYAGTVMWGNAMNLPVRRDSSARLIPLQKQ